VESKHEVECFAHIFNNCSQNSFAVLSFIKDLLHKVKQEYSVVTTAYLRSDNVGCYHSGHLLLSLREVGVRTGAGQCDMISQNHRLVRTSAIGRLLL